MQAVQSLIPNAQCANIEQQGVTVIPQGKREDLLGKKRKGKPAPGCFRLTSTFQTARTHTHTRTVTAAHAWHNTKRFPALDVNSWGLYIPGAFVFDICSMFVPFGSMLVPFGSIYVSFGSIYVPFGSIYVPFGSIYVPFGSIYVPFGSIYVPLCSWYQVPGTGCLVPGTWYRVPGTRYLVLGTWYRVPGTGYLVPGT